MVCVWILCLVLTFEFSFPAAACMQPSKGHTIVRVGVAFPAKNFYHFTPISCRVRAGGRSLTVLLKPLRNFSSACRARARKGGGREIAERVAHFGRPRARAVACPAAQPGRPVP